MSAAVQFVRRQDRTALVPPATFSRGQPKLLSQEQQNPGRAEVAEAGD